MEKNELTLYDTSKPAEQKDAFELHDQGLICSAAHAFSLLGQAESWYWLKKIEGYKKIDAGYSSIYEYVNHYFNKSKVTVDKIIKIYEVFKLKFERGDEELRNLGWGKLSKLISIVDEDNVDSILIEAQEMTQQEIDRKIKLERGLAPNEVEINDEFSKITFKGPKEAIDFISQVILEAKYEYIHGTDKRIEDVLDFQALEVVCANYFNVYDREENDKELTLKRTISALSSAYNKTITVTDKENSGGIDEY
jgi:hypothetical protein